MISKQKEVFNELLDERLDEITELDEKVNSDNLIHRYKCRTADAEFNAFDNALDLIDKIRERKISLTDVKNNQVKFKSSLGEIKKSHKNRSKEQKYSLHNIEMLYKAGNEAIKFYDGYSSMVSDAKNQAIKETKQRETGLKILTSKQLLQRLPTALALVKAGNNSENLLSEIRQIVYSLYQSKKISKNVYNNIIKSIQ